MYEHTCAQLVRAVLDGYNACCFAYGATGGGKTHTMVGTHEEPGCMVKALNELFREMDENHDFTFRVSKPLQGLFEQDGMGATYPNLGYVLFHIFPA